MIFCSLNTNLNLVSENAFIGVDLHPEQTIRSCYRRIYPTNHIKQRIPGDGNPTRHSDHPPTTLSSDTHHSLQDVWDSWSRSAGEYRTYSEFCQSDLWESLPVTEWWWWCGVWCLWDREFVYGVRFGVCCYDWGRRGRWHNISILLLSRKTSYVSLALERE